MVLSMSMSKSKSILQLHIRRRRRRLGEYWTRLVYHWLGPTTVHYQFEATLLLVVVLITIANLLSIRQTQTQSSQTLLSSGNSDSGGGWATLWRNWCSTDGFYTCLVALWLSRHLFVRWLCLWDTRSTFHAPTLLGFFSLFLTAHVSCGHTFDRPSVHATNCVLTGSSYSSSSSSNSNSATTLLGGSFVLTSMGGGSAGGSGSSSNTGVGGGGNFHASQSSSPSSFSASSSLMNGRIRLLDLIPISFKYLLVWLRNWCGYLFHYPVFQPLTRSIESASIEWQSLLADGTRRIENQCGWRFSRPWMALQQSVYSRILLHGPTLPFLLPVLVFIWYARQWYDIVLGGSWSSSSRGASSFSSLYEDSIPIAHLNQIRTANHILSDDEEEDEATFATAATTTHHHHPGGGGGGDSENSRAAQQHNAFLRQTFSPPTWWQVWLVIVSAGIVWTILYYRRIMLPLPDQRAGSNVLKDGKLLETAAADSGGSSSNSSHHNINSGFSAHSRFNRSSSSSTRNHHYRDRDSVDSALLFTTSSWPERSRPLESRVRLEWNVRMFRLVEVIFLCGVLPRTAWLCQASGRCAPPSPWEWTRILYPIGVDSALRKDGPRDSDSGSWFVGSYLFGLWICFNLAVVTLLLLMAQTIVLNKTYYALLAFVANEWDPVEEYLPSSNNLTSTTKTTTTTTTTASSTPEFSEIPPVWDARRKYKKGNVVRYPPAGPGQFIYRATIHAPESAPTPPPPSQMDAMPLASLLLLLFLRDSSSFLSIARKELGHPFTSPLLGKLALVQCLMLIVELVRQLLQFLLLLFSTTRTRRMSSTSLLFLLRDGGSGWMIMAVAHGVAAYVLLRVGAPRWNRLRQLTDEIHAATTNQPCT